MTEKIERARRNAQRALDAYQATPGADPDPLAAVGDLITDLMHLADELGRNATPSDVGYDFTDPSRETAGAYCHRIAADHHQHESDPANAHEHV
jgi:hypothetical protein